ncbi:hypothetical protein M1L60_24035 [Actinoplanes sp. TRM 88003]|uniref:Uncharacterized protein n=1 Tax=Paractinoplanes aksuensis TaxID=2939490 RepID=A0ABT1DUN4_9ACTN|nr:hypothetical protein [Actinoplanes aksuensis]MCO8273670.1 hypothetical protein [Actinoplanes aksuensis]
MTQPPGRRTVCPPRVLAARHGIQPTYVTMGGTFLAVLTEEQIVSLRADPDVDSVEKLGPIQLQLR